MLIIRVCIVGFIVIYGLLIMGFVGWVLIVSVNYIIVCIIACGVSAIGHSNWGFNWIIVRESSSLIILDGNWMIRWASIVVGEYRYVRDFASCCLGT